MGKHVSRDGADRGNPGVQAAPGGEATTDRRASLSAYVNDQGEICVGQECFKMGYDTKRDELTVRLDEENCPPELLDAFEKLQQGVSKGAPTIYERRRKQKR